MWNDFDVPATEADWTELFGSPPNLADEVFSLVDAEFPGENVASFLAAAPGVYEMGSLVPLVLIGDALPLVPAPRDFPLGPAAGLQPALNLDSYVKAPTPDDTAHQDPLDSGEAGTFSATPLAQVSDKSQAAPDTTPTAAQQVEAVQLAMADAAPDAPAAAAPGQVTWTTRRDGKEVKHNSETVDAINAPNAATGDAFGRTNADPTTFDFHVEGAVKGGKGAFFITTLDVDIKMELAKSFDGKALNDRSLADTRAHETTHLRAFTKILNRVQSELDKIDTALNEAGDPNGAKHKRAAADLNKELPGIVKAIMIVEVLRQDAHLDHLDKQKAQAVNDSGQKIFGDPKLVGNTYRDILNKPSVLADFNAKINKLAKALQLQGITGNARNADQLDALFDKMNELLYTELVAMRNRVINNNK
ncbi:MAG: hypothetical protein ACREHD_05520 [Pirellulales bacterium]